MGAVNAAGPQQVAHFYSSQFDVKVNERFCVGRQGRGLVFASLDGFQMLTSDGKVSTLPAPDGGRLALDSDSGHIVLQSRTGSLYGKVIIANPITGAQEFWGDAYDLRQIVPTSSGLTVSYGLLDSSEGRLGLVTGKDEMQELLRLEAVPTHLCATGTRLVYFLGSSAYTLDLASPSTPKLLGRLPSDPTATVLTQQGVTAITKQDVWRIPLHGAAYRMSAETGMTSLFLQGRAVIMANLRGAWICEGSQCRTIEAPNSNLHYVGPIEGSDDLILCRGPVVLRYFRKTGKLERIGSGRQKMKLRGAAIANDKLLTWSSQTWEATGGGCSLTPPPRVYLVE